MHVYARMRMLKATRETDLWKHVQGMAGQFYASVERHASTSTSGDLGTLLYNINLQACKWRLGINLQDPPAPAEPHLKFLA